MAQPIVGSKTPVSLLQEWAVRNKIVPEYILGEVGGEPHNPRFEYRVNVASYTAVGVGKSKSVAKHEAASKLLDMIDARENPEFAHSFKDMSAPQDSVINAVGDLSQYCCEKNHPQPELEMIGNEGPPHAKIFTYCCKVSQLTEIGQAGTKQGAKHSSALKMLAFLKKQDGEDFQAVVKISKCEALRNAIEIQDSGPKKFEYYQSSPVTKFSEYGNSCKGMVEGSPTLINIMNTNELKTSEEEKYLDIVVKICNELELAVSKIQIPVDKNGECLIMKLNTTVPLCSIGDNEEEAAHNLLMVMRLMMK